MKINSMAHKILFAALLATFPAKAELSSMPEKEWLGYFVAWEESDYDVGVGTDGEFLMYMKKNRERVTSREMKINYLVQEKIDGKWVSRQLDEKSLSSESKPEVDPSEPVKIQMTVTGGTKVEFTHVISNDLMTVRVKLLEKKTEKPLRLGLKINTFSFRNEVEDMDERDIKRKFRSEKFEAVRKKDGEKVDVRFYETVDMNSEKFLKEGATEVEIDSDEFYGGDFMVKLGDEDSGVIEVETREKLYDGYFKFTWLPNMDKLGERDTFVSFGID